MFTMVGRQENFSEAIESLVVLQYDMVGAYEEAIKRLDKLVYRSKLIEFKQDYKRITLELLQLLQAHHLDLPESLDFKKWVAKTSILLAGLVGDRAVLLALLCQEKDVKEAYTRLLSHEKLWKEVSSILKSGQLNQQRHQQLIENFIEMEEALS